MGGKGIFLVANRGLLVYDCWRIVVVPCSLHRRCQLACKGALHTSTQAAKRKQKKRQKQHKPQTDNVQVQRSNFIVRETDQRLPEGHCPSPCLCRWVLNNQFPSPAATHQLVREYTFFPLDWWLPLAFVASCLLISVTEIDLVTKFCGFGDFLKLWNNKLLLF